MRYAPTLIGTLLLASACATIQPVPSTSTPFPDLSKFKIKGECKPDDPEKAAFKVAGYLLDHEKASYNELVFVITIPETGNQFLSQQAFELGEDRSEEIYRKFIFWVKTDGAWSHIAEADTRVTSDGDSEKILKRVMATFRQLLPEKYRENSFRQLYEDAGCTTHGPGPFWS